MNTHISPALIMRIKEFGESDLLVTFFTSDYGRLQGIAKGARKSRKRFANCLDLFCLTNLEYNLKRTGGLHFLHSCKLLDTFPGLRSDFFSLSLASYFVELTEILFPLNVADNNMFELLKNSFIFLGTEIKSNIIRIQFETKAMVYGGYEIKLDKCILCGRKYNGEGRAVFIRSKGGIACMRCEKESKFSPVLDPETVKELTSIQSSPLSKRKMLHQTEKTISEISQVLKLHMGYHIGKKLKSSKYIE